MSTYLRLSGLKLEGLQTPRAPLVLASLNSFTDRVFTYSTSEEQRTRSVRLLKTLCSHSEESPMLICFAKYGIYYSICILQRCWQNCMDLKLMIISISVFFFFQFLFIFMHRSGWNENRMIIIGAQHACIRIFPSIKTYKIREMGGCDNINQQIRTSKGNIWYAKCLFVSI